MLSRSHELRLEILEQVLGWKLLVVDLDEYQELFALGKSAKADREEYIMSRLRLGEDASGHESDDDPHQSPSLHLEIDPI